MKKRTKIQKVLARIQIICYNRYARVMLKPLKNMGLIRIVVYWIGNANI